MNKDLNKNISLVRFTALAIAAVGMTYFAPEVFTILFFICTLVWYLRSDDEPLWFAFFLILIDGFFGFFGFYETTLAIIPGLPAIEVTQLYILAAVFKAIRVKDPPKVFYQLPLAMVFIYLGFLIVQGFVLGIEPEMNIIFRVFKMAFPFLLFWALPRLLRSEEDYVQCFRYLFLVAIAAFAAQVFTLVMFQTPPMFLGLEDLSGMFDADSSRDETYRGAYNLGIVLITLFGAAYFLVRRSAHFKPGYLYLILVCNYLSMFLSATRGWILGFSLFLGLFLLIELRHDFRRVFALMAVAVALGAVTISVPVIQVQVHKTIDRLETLEALKEGDVTADGTLLRLTTRSPKVMRKWAESPLTGWGFSDTFFDYGDSHVANQNVLMHAGLIGYALLVGFLFYFCLKLAGLSMNLPPQHPKKDALLLFGLFFLGWFLIHSTSMQFFGYHLNPGLGMIQALFFSMGAALYQAVAQEKRRSSWSDIILKKSVSVPPPQGAGTVVQT
jgi:hypothetical protein